MMTQAILAQVPPCPAWRQPLSNVVANEGDEGHAGDAHQEAAPAMKVTKVGRSDACRCDIAPVLRATNADAGGVAMSRHATPAMMAINGDTGDVARSRHAAPAMKAFRRASALILTTLLVRWDTAQVQSAGKFGPDMDVGQAVRDADQERRQVLEDIPGMAMTKNKEK